ncbi:MAG TPA: MFS transporter [Actinophytocola sp.]|uniref:MFS transporter n=1 Tax=Actinophytocola sp. TaxID=1872138 RepID=UPI002F92B4F3
MTRLWLAAVCSETGEWMLQIALPILVYQATGSAASTAAMMIVGLLPAVLLSPAAGVLADRLDRRKLLLAVSAGQALVAAPLLAMDSAVWVGYVVMAGQAGLAALFEPARNALVRDLVGSDGVTAANGMLGMGTNVSRLVGAWLGGALFAGGGIAVVYLAYAVVLLVAVGALVTPFGTTHEPAPRGPAIREWLDGLDMIRRDRRLWVIGTAMMMGAVSQGMFLALYVPFVLDVLGAGPQGAGLLRGVQAIGGLAAGVGVAVLARRVAPRRLLGWGAVAFGAVSALLWNGPHVTTALAVYIGLFVAAGVPAVVATSGLLSTLQTAVPPAATGRLMSSAFAAMALGNALGMAVAGAGASSFGLLLDVQAALNLLSGVLVLVARPEHAPHAAVPERASR